MACVQRTKNKSRTVDSIDLKTMFRKKFYRAYIIGASITFRVKIVAEMKLCTRCMLDSHLASTDLQFSWYFVAVFESMLKLNRVNRDTHHTHITFLKKKKKNKLNRREKKQTPISNKNFISRTMFRSRRRDARKHPWSERNTVEQIKHHIFPCRDADQNGIVVGF